MLLLLLLLLLLQLLLLHLLLSPAVSSALQGEISLGTNTLLNTTTSEPATVVARTDEEESITAVHAPTAANTTVTITAADADAAALSIDSPNGGGGNNGRSTPTHGPGRRCLGRRRPGSSRSGRVRWRLT